MAYKGHKIGTGKQGHSGGAGKDMSGAGNWGGGVAASNPGTTVVGHATSAGKGKGYNTEAHTDAHHYHGEAVGAKADIRPMEYANQLHMEGKMLPHQGDGARSARAEHHPAPSGEAHKFAGVVGVKVASGYGHSITQRKGPLRMSGHPKGHRIGCK